MIHTATKKMRFVVLSFIIFVLASAVTAQIKRVNVTVYYEHLCPFARAFIVKQLYPALQGKLANYVDLVLVPYGKAETIVGTDNTLEFKCRHGPNECYGDKVQACALTLIDAGGNTPGLTFNKKTLGFISCLMNQTSHGPSTNEFCAQLNNVNNIKLIEQCTSQALGSLYLAKLGNQTKNFQNPLGNVPTIVFSEEYKKEESDLAEKDFIKALCAKIQGEKPAECHRNGSETFYVHVGLLLITMVTRYIY